MLDLIEQVTALRGQVRTLEAEWDDMRAQIRKGYQRMEKAYERQQAREEECEDCPDQAPPALVEGHPGNRFLEKYRRLKA